MRHAHLVQIMRNDDAAISMSRAPLSTTSTRIVSSIIIDRRSSTDSLSVGSVVLSLFQVQRGTRAIHQLIKRAPL